MAIQVLDDDTINKIAAGEVVERPSSVVKELVENAIDAKATAITVEIKNGGITFIRVADNGTGIEEADIRKAFLRHATSKIKTVEDLMCVNSLGFRGEALSSIVSVSSLELITKTKDSLVAYRYASNGGVEEAFDEVGAPDGTSIIVKNLFYNTPVRRKFLKSAATEAGYVDTLMQHLALSHPEISFRFIVDGKNKLHTSGNSNFRDIIYNVYGKDIEKNLLRVNASIEGISMEGYIARPVVVRGSRIFENYYINKRYIKNFMITKAIEDAYKGFHMPRNFPFTALLFEVDPSLIDVNVHPTKMELRFTTQNQVYDFVYSALRDVLENQEMAVEVDLEPEKEQTPRQVEKAKTEDYVRERLEEKSDRKPEGKFEEKSDEKSVDRSVEKSGTKSEEEPILSHKSNFEKRLTTDYSSIKPSASSINENSVYGSKSAASQQDISDKKIDSQQDISDKKAENQQGQANFKTQAPKIDSDAFANLKKRLPEPFEKKASEDLALAKEEIYKADSMSKAKQAELFDNPLLKAESVDKIKIIGQAFETYWIFEYMGKLYICDQHAAHEKVMYERLMKKIKSNAKDSQMLMPPLIIDLTMQEENAYKEYEEEFKKIGFEIEEFGGRSYKVVGLPANLPDIDLKELLIDMIGDLVGENKASLELLTMKVASMACKAAVKGNNKLSELEVKNLLEELMQADNPYNCPHGRPTLIVMSKYEIEKKFKRIV